MYAEIREKGFFSEVDWQSIRNKLEEQGHSHTCTWNGCMSSLTIRDGAVSPIIKAVLKLVDA